MAQERGKPAGQDVRPGHQGRKWAKPQIRATLRPSENYEMDEEVTERTREEVMEGEAIGPMTEEEVNQRHGKMLIPA